MFLYLFMCIYMNKNIGTLKKKRIVMNLVKHQTRTLLLREFTIVHAKA